MPFCARGAIKRDSPIFFISTSSLFAGFFFSFNVKAITTDVILVDVFPFIGFFEKDIDGYLSVNAYRVSPLAHSAFDVFRSSFLSCQYVKFKISRTRVGVLLNFEKNEKTRNFTIAKFTSRYSYTANNNARGANIFEGPFVNLRKSESPTIDVR